MTWVAVSDTAYDDPRFMRLGPVASWLHVCALAWCGRQLTDGALPRAMLARLGGSPEDAKALVEEGLWVENTDGWQVDWSGQRSAKDVLAKREANMLRQRNHRVSSQSQRDKGRDSRRDSGRDQPRDCAPPLLSSPILSQKQNPPAPSEPPPARARGRAKAARVRAADPSTWTPSPAHEAQASEAGVSCSDEACKFRDYIAAKGVQYRDLDAAFRNWLRNAAGYRRGAADLSKQPPAKPGEYNWRDHLKVVS